MKSKVPLPPTVRVKLSSEAAGAISMTPVVVQELPIRDLLEHMLAITGKDEARLREILLRGSLVSGASRFRWAGWDPGPDSLSDLLATFPDPDPARPFAAQRCVRAVLRGSRLAIDLPREAAVPKGIFERGSFWELLMELAVAGAVYAGYSYRDRADRYLRQLSAAEADSLRAGCDRIRYDTLREQIRAAAFSKAELYTARQKGEAGGL